MNIQEALLTHKKVKRPSWDNYFIYYQAKTGPFKKLVDCDYFVYYEEGSEPMFSTSIDLYADDLLANDFEVFD
jgi:hypothetical protein